MKPVLVLDSEALDALTGGGSQRSTVRAALEAAYRLERRVIVPSVVLAELYRSRAGTQRVDSLLSRSPGLELRDTDRWMARLVGGLLSSAGMGSESLVDAHVVAAAVESGGGVCLTSDPSDLERLSAGAGSVTVVDIT